jgi:hypothetical protein
VKPEDGIQSQLRNIERTYGHSIEELTSVVASSGLTKHPEIVAMLKDRFGMSHGNAHRVALVARESLTPSSSRTSVGTATSALYDDLLTAVRSLGEDVEEAPKKGYVSLRRRKQFAMLQPAARWVNVGLILRDPAQGAGRLESAAKWNPLFTHRVRVARAEDIDPELLGLLRAAYDSAG